MNETSFDKSRYLRFYARIGEAGVSKVMTFVNSDGSPHSITSYDFEFPVKDKPGGRTLFTLTVGDGLTIIGDDDNQLQFDISQARAARRATTFFATLYSAAEDHTWLNGNFIFHNGKFDGVEETESITVSTDGGTVLITIEGGGGGSVTLESLGETLQTASADTPLDVDTSWFYDIADGVIKLWTWATQKSLLKTYFDTLYDSVGAAAAALVSANAYTDSQVVGLWDDRGNYNPTGTSDYPTTGGSGTAGAILKGDIWTVSVAGTISGNVVNIGDTVRALVDTPGLTDANWAIGENNIGYVPENQANKATTFGTVNDTLYPTVEAVTEYAVAITNTAVPLTDGAAITLTATKHTLTTDEATITFTDSFAGDFLGAEIILSGITGATWTFPAGSLCFFMGTATGTNVMTISGAVAGDNIVLSRWNSGNKKHYVAINNGQ